VTALGSLTKVPVMAGSFVFLTYLPFMLDPENQDNQCKKAHHGGLTWHNAQGITKRNFFYTLYYSAQQTLN
jgi:hypothetical protein